ncbi:hypothetical protein ACJMK2_017974 [Sinanodonta woodiana]|uniref:Uncharacterized protein n=1 Tax=Sinanodonta woodiana TaxID=1069815 RepID=A0ABD3UEP9_SINWO
MSSTSSYTTEMVSITSANRAHETDINIDDGYTAINDTSLPRKRRLPMPPASKPPRPKKNFTLCHKSCKELCSYCVGSRLILSIPLLFLALVALGVLIYLLVTNIQVPVPVPVSPFIQLPDPLDAGGIPEGSNGTLKFVMSPVQNPEVLNLLQESTGQNLTILQNVNLTNGTWSFDGRDISIEIFMTDKGYFHIVLNMEITNSQCRHAGKYFVLLSGSKGKAEQSLVYKVNTGCPCESEYELNFDKELNCELKVIGNTTISFNKVSGESIEPILYQTGIRIPDNVPERGRFSAMWNPSGTLTASINFLPVQCHDEGNYSLTVTSRMGTKLYYTYIKVIDHQYEPTISTLKELFEDIDNGLQCHAITGCKNASMILEATERKGNDYTPMPQYLTLTHYEEGYIWKTNATVTLIKYQLTFATTKTSRAGIHIRTTVISS